ncbi:MAG TPA: toll/interleukin-1 receptor domain-containing protein [Isosphaeraceae bacterium]|nr:toll/interleukin-1 receptor domain-containing protein [Isosphaeraceae bacterium]
MATIFLSHSSLDNETARAFSRRLKDRGYESLFLDFDPDCGIKGGREWERELYRNLKSAGAVIVLCSQHSMGSRWCFVEIAQAKALGKAIFPVRITPCQVESILSDRQVIDVAAIGEEEACRRLFDALRAAGLDPRDSFQWDATRPPFPGLNYFDTDDAGIYFGRDDAVRQLIEALTRIRRQGEPRLLLLVGSSGSGKSSLVRAGVLPRLGKDRSHWVVVAPFRPRTEPIAELARSLAPAFPESAHRPDWKSIREHLRDESREAGQGEVSAACPRNSVLTDYADDLTMLLDRREASVLLVVDQAEELLQNVAQEEAAGFLHVLRRAVERPGGRVFGLLTLRSDFLGSFQNHPALRGLAFSDLPLGLLPTEDFPQVIEGPADRAGLVLEPGLVHSMIADARTDDALPLLAFTLREMYERCRDQGRLTIRVYRDALGGIKGAVARVVERIKAEVAWTPEAGRALRRAFLKLVRVNDEGQFTRQACRWADLPDLAAPVLEAFVKARLLWSNGDVVEVTHESLFRVWPELAAWLDESRELMLWRKSIQDDLRDWIAHDRSADRFLTGARVVEARRWLGSNGDDFPAPEVEFLTASITAEDERIARERAQQEKVRRLARSLALGFVVASLLAVAAIGMGGYALVKREQASKAAAVAQAQTLVAQKATLKAKAQARIATSRQLAALSMAEQDKRIDRSLLLAVAALQTENTSEARDSLYNALQGKPGLRTLLHVDHGFPGVAAISPDGNTIAAGYYAGKGGGVVLFDLATRKRLGDEQLAVQEGHILSVAFSPDGRTIAAGYSGENACGVVTWDVATRKRLASKVLSVTASDVGSMAFSPDGKTIAVGYGDSFFRAPDRPTGVVLCEVASGKRLLGEPLLVQEGVVTRVTFSRDGKTLAGGYTNFLGGAGGVVVWDAASGKRLPGQALPMTEGEVAGVAFSPNGKTIMAGYQHRNVGGVVLWDLVTRKRLDDEPLAVSEGPVHNVAFSPNGETIAAGCTGGVVLWDLAARKRLATFSQAVTAMAVSSVAFSADGKTVAAAYFGESHTGPFGGVALWDLAAPNRLMGEPLFMKESASGVAFSPNGETLAAGYIAENVGGVALWNAATRRRLGDEPLAVNEGQVRSVAFSPDGKTIMAGYAHNDSGGVVLWDLATRKRLSDEPLAVKENTVQSVAFGPDGKTIAAGYGDLLAGGVVLWDLATRKRLGDPLVVAEGKVSSVAFSPVGSTIAARYNGAAATGVALWDLATRKRIASQALSTAEGEGTSVAFSPDGETIAAAYYGGVVLWDSARRERLGDLLVLEQGNVRSIAFSPDGKSIAGGYTGPAGGGVALWDLAAPKRPVVASISVKQSEASSVAFSPDGKTIAAGYKVWTLSSFDDDAVNGVLLWDVDKNSWRRLAGQIANRNFTREEWREYFPEEPYRAMFPDLPVPPDVPAKKTNPPAGVGSVPSKGSQ